MAPPMNGVQFMVFGQMLLDEPLGTVARNAVDRRPGKQGQRRHILQERLSCEITLSSQRVQFQEDLSSLTSSFASVTSRSSAGTPLWPEVLGRKYLAT